MAQNLGTFVSFLKLNLVLLFFCSISQAQVFTSNPTLGFSQACASDSFNTFSVAINYNSATVQNNNQYSIELSDIDGDFTNSQIISPISVTQVNLTRIQINFEFPETTAGENYRLRVRSSAPATTSQPTQSFAAYFKLQDSPFSINNLVPTGAYCTGSSYVLSIDNPGSDTNDSPLQYDSLTYRWFRVTGPTTSVEIPGENGPTLEVDTEGTYFVETDYGTCTSDSASNRVTISEASNGQADATIVSSLGNPYCPTQGSTTLNTIGGIGYQWFLDGEIIEGATNQMYETNESGTFTVQVDLGDCMASGTIDLMSELFNSDINVDEVNTLEEGETLTVIVTDDAIDPSYEWFLNGTLIPNETDATLDATQLGEYTVIITENGGSCLGAVEYQFSINNQFPNVDNIPNLISPNGDTINDTWIIPLEYTTGTNTSIRIFSSQGELVFETNDYQNDWPIENLDLNAINQVFYYVIETENGNVQKGSITVIR